MTALYDHYGVQFQFPENWELQDDRSDDWPKLISVHNATGAFWSLTIYEDVEPPVRVVQQAVDAMREEYEDVEQHPLDLELVDTPLHGVELQFYCLDFLVQSRLMTGIVEHRTFLVTWQAEDRDFDEMEPVFRAITVSFLRNQTPST